MQVFYFIDSTLAYTVILQHVFFSKKLHTFCLIHTGIERLWLAYTSVC